MRRALRRSLAVFAVLVFVPAVAFAQSGSGIAGVVKDASGAVVPGVTVEAASPALIEKVRSVTTDAAGQYKIVDLRPGVYSVTFTLAGFSTVKREGIELTSSFTATVNADMRVGTLQETITVSGEAPTVDVQNVVQQRVMSREVLDGAPLGTKQAAAVGALIPGVVASSQDVGGTQFTAASISIHGGRSGEMLILFDGMDASRTDKVAAALTPRSRAMMRPCTSWALKPPACRRKANWAGFAPISFREMAATSSKGRSSPTTPTTTSRATT